MNSIKLQNVSASEENYLKEIAIYAEWSTDASISTTQLASELKTSAAAVTDMFRKLTKKKLINYTKYQGASLTEEGLFVAKQTVRRQRIWQYFLAEKLKINLDDAKQISNELEHIKSEVLTTRLDSFLGNPTYSPFGEPIPDPEGSFGNIKKMLLYEMKEGETGIVAGISDRNPTLIQYLNKKGIYIGAKVIVIEKLAFDGSMDICIDNQPKTNISSAVAENMFVTF